MIYKFNGKEVNSENEDFSLEFTKENDKVLMTVYDSGQEFVIGITRETIYDIIGALHSLQTKINKEVNNEK